MPNDYYDNDSSRYSRSAYGAGSASGNRSDAGRRQAAPRQRASQAGYDNQRASYGRPDANQYRDRSRYTQDAGSAGRRAGAGQTAARRHGGRTAQQGGYGAVNPATAGASRARQNDYHYGGGADGSNPSPKKKRGKNKVAIIIVLVVVLLGLGVGGYFAATWFWPVTITINGQTYSVNGAKDVATAREKSGLTLKPGNYTDVTGTVMENGKGYEYSAWVNDVQVYDMTTKLKDGDAVKLADGQDIMEDHTDSTTEVSATFSVTGNGAVHLYQGTGAPGIQTLMTGKVTGKTASVMTTQPDNVVLRYYNVDTTDKVIALTFDDGPSTYTQDVLDVLAQYNAKATFFTLGFQIEDDWEKALVKKASDAGHQICTHTYSHATTSDGTGQADLSVLSVSEQLDDVNRGLQAIRNVIGKEPSRVFRAPGGNFPESVAQNLLGTVTAEIGWNIDTRDWSCPGTDAIVQQLLNAASGDIVLMHDGGGDRSQTIAALRTALPQLVNQGYKFVTLDELLAYPVPTA